MTKTDTLVFVWRLELPKHIPVAVAANAMLSVALAVPRKTWHRQQLMIMKELMTLANEDAGGDSPITTETRKLVTSGRKPVDKNVSGLERLLKSSTRYKRSDVRTAPEKHNNRSSDNNNFTPSKVRPTVARHAKPVETEQEMRERKQNKDWWHLVGSGAKKPADKN